MHETHLVDSGCNHRTARVSLRRNPSTHVNQVHDTAAQEVPERVGIIWQSNISVLRSGLSYRTPVHRSNHACASTWGRSLATESVLARVPAESSMISAVISSWRKAR